MNDWQVIILEELKSINRKIERLEDKINIELAPLKRNTTQVRFTAVLLTALVPLAGVLYSIFK